ncbi:hypothetical protein GCM10027024_10000 [Microbacterium insulae]
MQEDLLTEVSCVGHLWRDGDREADPSDLDDNRIRLDVHDGAAD